MKNGTNKIRTIVILLAVVMVGMSSHRAADASRRCAAAVQMQINRGFCFPFDFENRKQGRANENFC
jgi:hypothetical protein